MPEPEQQIAKETRRKPRKMGPFSRERSLIAVDGRTQPGRVLRDTEKQILAEIGPKVTVAQRLIAKSAALKATRIAMLTRKVIAEGAIAEGTDTQALAWMNGLRADLSALGLLHSPRLPKSANSNDPDDQEADLLAAHLRGRAAG